MAAQTSTPIIPAPARLRPAIGEFQLVPGTTVAYRDPILAPLIHRFAQDAARRCGIALNVGTGERAPAIVIDLGDDPDFAGLPAPLGLDPAGPPRDERYALTIDRSGIRLRAREPAGVARGLTSLLQLIATGSASASTTATATATVVPLPALDILDAPRFAWRGLTVDVVRRFFPPTQIRTLTSPTRRRRPTPGSGNAVTTWGCAPMRARRWPTPSTGNRSPCSARPRARTTSPGSGPPCGARPFATSTI